MNQKDVLMRSAQNYINSQNWKYSMVGKNGDVFEINMGLDCKLKKCRLLVFTSERDIQSIAVCPLNASQDSYADVVEFLTRANYGLKLGNFEFDYSDGEIRYQSILSCVEGVPNMRDVERVVDVPILMMERYGNGLVKNLMGFGNPKQDIEEIER